MLLFGSSIQNWFVCIYKSLGHRHCLIHVADSLNLIITFIYPSVLFYLVFINSLAFANFAPKLDKFMLSSLPSI